MVAAKYPANSRLLPAGFGEGASDNNSLIALEGKIYAEPFVALSPSPESLGINCKSPKISTTIAFGEIYVLWAIGTTIYKIGCSRGFPKRFKSLAASSPIPLEVIKYARCDHPHLLEAHLHEVLKHRLFKNEWFSLDAEHLEAINSIFDRYFEKRNVTAD